MKFPETLTVTILERDTNLPIEGLAVVLELFATRKNNYIVGPVVSDSSGQVKFTRDECERSIKAAKEMFLMDHIDDLEECKEFLDVRLHSPEHIAAMLQRYHASPTFWGKRFQNAPQLFKTLGDIRDASFESVNIRVNNAHMLANPNLTMRISRKYVHSPIAT